jgi:micrococcal nuclease
MKREILVGILLMASASLSLAQSTSDELVGKVITVVDGNTLEVIGNDNQTHTIFLMGIDSPELNQEFGDKAKRMLEKLSLEKNVMVRFKGKDRKGNDLAEVLVEGKIDIRIELLKEGMAWTTERNPLPELEEHRIKAQQKGKGLWKQEDPTPPWTFRRQQTMLQAKSSS